MTRKCLGSGAMGDASVPVNLKIKGALITCRCLSSSYYKTLNTMSGTPGPSNTGKAIASLAKMPADTTRAGTQKMKFVPTLPTRRKKEYVRPPVIHRSYIAYPRVPGRNLQHKLPPQVVHPHPLIVVAEAKGVVVGGATHREVRVEPHPRDHPSRR